MERLRAMRLEDFQAGPFTTPEASATHRDLSNPFGNIYVDHPMQDDLQSAPRFGFYTHPMAAFSGNNKKNMYSRPPIAHYTPEGFAGSHFAQVTSPGYPPERSQFQTVYSPYQQIHRAPNPYNGHGSYRSPLRMTSPSPSYQVRPPTPVASYNNFPSNASTRSNFQYHPGFVQVGHPRFTPNQGRGQWFNRGHGTGRNPGRGNYCGFSNNTSRDSGLGGGRGRGRGGSHKAVSAQEKPHLFYSKSMVEDPWKFLEPVHFNVPGLPRLGFPNQLQ